jgi:hypothetical protein
MIRQSLFGVASIAGGALITETTTNLHPDAIAINDEQNRTKTNHATRKAAASKSLIQQQQLAT